MTGKQTQGAVAYDGTGALKMAAPEAPAQKKKFRKKETKGKKETKETQHPVVKNGAALLTKGARWTVPGAILAILTVALVVVITLASYAQLVVVNDKVVELRNELSELQSEETQLKAQYELAYDLQEIERQMLASGEMMKVQSWQNPIKPLRQPAIPIWALPWCCISSSFVRLRESKSGRPFPPPVCWSKKAAL